MKTLPTFPGSAGPEAASGGEIAHLCGHVAEPCRRLSRQSWPTLRREPARRAQTPREPLWLSLFRDLVGNHLSHLSGVTSNARDLASAKGRPPQPSGECVRTRCKDTLHLFWAFWSSSSVKSSPSKQPWWVKDLSWGFPVAAHDLLPCAATG
jgi:hypothetical protein